LGELRDLVTAGGECPPRAIREMAREGSNLLDTIRGMAPEGSNLPDTIRGMAPEGSNLSDTICGMAQGRVEPS